MTNNPTIDGVSRDLVECDACPNSGGCVKTCMKAAPAIERQEPVSAREILRQQFEEKNGQQGWFVAGGSSESDTPEGFVYGDFTTDMCWTCYFQVADALQTTIAQLQALLREADDFMYIMTGDDTQKHLDAKYGELAWEDAIVELRGRIATAALNGVPK